jgi:hypothetical protein
MIEPKLLSNATVMRQKNPGKDLLYGPPDGALFLDL